jgi:hypothetical protein
MEMLLVFCCLICQYLELVKVTICLMLVHYHLLHALMSLQTQKQAAVNLQV